ncbi:hypothetical protein WJX81_002406 [Elliptochloris bilobata]|uniref:Clathrin/coatomer adaptor adaptin-like N-terminal domain-containing protein n=1 Tax=Elliptochloris bilobata TaxID=381761 RepID=A0AAW1RUV2_9CHLO
MATCNESTVTIWEGGSGDPLWTRLASFVVPLSKLTHVAWAPPEYGSMVAVAAMDGSLSVLEAWAGQRWKRTASLQGGRCSVTAMEFAPKDHGLLLAVASKDGYVRLYRADVEESALSWEEDNDFRACVGGACTSLAWRQDPADLQPLLLIGSQRGAEVWMYRAGLGRWVPAARLGPPEPVACVHWACTMGRPVELVAVGAGSHVTVFSLQGAADIPKVEQVAVLELGAAMQQVASNLAKKAALWSREFDGLIRAIGECKSKAEEDAIIGREVEILKPRLKDAKLDKHLLKEFLVRLIYVEMLGHDASWGHVKALQACSDTSLVTKKVAYLASSLFLDYKSDLIILVVNTITQDLKSDNYLVVCAALTAVGKLIGPDLINAVLPAVVGLVSHPKELVRKKAVMALHRFQQLDPDRDGALAGSELDKHFRQALCDKDPSVMNAALCALHEAVARTPQPYRNLIPSFVSILKQVAEHRLPKAYDYHRTPAPFIQIKLLKTLALLGAGDKAASENMYAVVSDAMRRANTGHTIGNAIVYECVRTIAAIFPNPALLQSAAEMVSGFVKASSHNLKYCGIDALARVVRINAKYAGEHQVAVIDCLEDPDETLRRKTLDLLFKMTRPSNVEVIVEKMLDYLRTTGDEVQKGDVAKRIGELAERFAPDTQWFIDTMNQVFELGGDVVAPALAHGLMRLVAEGAGEGDEAADTELRAQAATAYIRLLAKPKLPDILLKVACWVLGEYGALAPGGAVAARDRLVATGEAAALSDDIRGYLLSALAKLSAQLGLPLGAAGEELVALAAASHSADLQQRALELRTLLAAPAAVRAAALPADASCEDLEVDPTLPFLDAHVASALANGAAPYIAEEQRFAMGAVRPSHHDEATDHSHALRFTAYEKAAPPSDAAPVAAPANSGTGRDRSRRTGQLEDGDAARDRAAAEAEPQLALRAPPVGARRWGPAQSAPAAPAVAPAAAAPGRELQGSAPAGADALPSGKAQLAASLFGDSAPARRGPRVRAAPKADGSLGIAVAPAATSHMEDLLGGLSAPPPQAAAPASSDPFSMLEGLSHPAPAAEGGSSGAGGAGGLGPATHSLARAGAMAARGAAPANPRPAKKDAKDPFADLLG